MKRVLLQILLCFLYVGLGVAAYDRLAPPPVQTYLPNGCLIAAYSFQQAKLAEAFVGGYAWARIVQVTYLQWFKKPVGHAICVFALRNGDVWAYDILNGSVPLNTRSHDIKDIAAALHQRDIRIHYAHYID